MLLTSRATATGTSRIIAVGHSHSRLDDTHSHVNLSLANGNSAHPHLCVLPHPPSETAAGLQRTDLTTESRDRQFHRCILALLAQRSSSREPALFPCDASWHYTSLLLTPQSHYSLAGRPVSLLDMHIACGRRVTPAASFPPVRYLFSTSGQGCAPVVSSFATS